MREDGRGRIVDLRLYEAGAGGTYLFEGAEYPARTLGPIGRIGGKRVRGVPSEIQVSFYQGYEFDEADARDVLLLCSHFGVPVPEAYADRAKGLRTVENQK